MLTREQFEALLKMVDPNLTARQFQDLRTIADPALTASAGPNLVNPEKPAKRAIRLEPTKWWRLEHQSSMVRVADALDAYNTNANSGTLLRLVECIGLNPDAKKAKYQRALDELYASFPSEIFVGVEPHFAVSETNNVGIVVSRSSRIPSNQVDTILALRALHNNRVGRELLGHIIDNFQRHDVRVTITDVNGYAGRCNACRGARPGRPAWNALTEALENNPTSIGAEIANALTALGHPPPQGYNWLEGEIDRAPIYETIDGQMPNVTPSSRKHGTGWISAALLQQWTTNPNAFQTWKHPNPNWAQQMNTPSQDLLRRWEMAEDVKKVLETVLAAGAASGTRMGSTVFWSAHITTAAGRPRPPYIALGHELIHALYNQRGEQPDTEGGILYEYMATGLGYFKDNPNFPYTENALRKAASPPIESRKKY